MLKIFALASTTALALTCMSVGASAQVQRAPTDDKSPPKKMMTMKKSKSMHHSVHHGMTAKPM